MLHAHTKDGLDEAAWQGLEEHLHGVARLAEGFAERFNAGNWGRAAGFLHDVGKQSPEFQHYLRHGGPRGSVDHATAGAVCAVGLSPYLGRLLAYALAGHHGGLPDGRGGPWRSLDARLEKGASYPPLTPGLTIPPSLPFQPDLGRHGFELSFFIRMVYSCLVDADFLDTEWLMDPEKGRGRAGYASLGALAARFFPRLAEKAAMAASSDVNLLRADVLRQCRAKAGLPPGLFSLTVPTGGGKTLSSLAFALDHAQAHDLTRIVYVIPYMSIIEQNAAVFRQFLEPGGEGDAVVEHHGSFDFGRYDDEETPVRAKLASENWDAPVIATTAVQFFESLFAAKPSKCRKLHNLARSVIILDEAQMLPQSLLLPCLEALRELTLHYGATVVLCTATQPALERRQDFPLGLVGVREIIDDPAGLHVALRRTRVENVGALSDEDVVDRLSGARQVLCVVNTKRHAREVFERLVAATGDALHLSASMCPAHRSERVAVIKARLKAGEPCRVVATSLIEAGVDVDFPVVYRAVSGIDAIAQAAGRCNREGLLGPDGGRVVVFRPEKRDWLPRGHFTITADKGAEVMRHHGDVLSPAAVEHYFRLLFWSAGEALDRERILVRLGEDAKRGNFPFRAVAEDFRVIKDGQTPVIVPYNDEARGLIEKLRFVENPGPVLRRLQRYAVQVWPKALAGLKAEGAVQEDSDGVYVLIDTDIYGSHLGLVVEDPSFREIASNIL